MDAGWSDFYATGTIAVDTTEFVLGTSSMRITAGNGGGNSGIRNNITDFNGSANGYSFWVRSNNWSQLATAQLLLSTNGVFTDFYFVDLKNFLVSPPTNEWIEIVVPRTNFTASGAPNWATVNDVIFRVTGTVGNTPTLWVDDLIRYKSASKGMVTLAFDDGEATQFTVAKPQMDRYHFVGTAYVIWDAIGTGGTYMTQTQVDGLHQGGWDIAGHGGTNLTTLTAAQIDADVSSMRNYLLNRGYRGADHYALPNGAYSSTTLPIVEKYFSTQRTIDTFSNDANYVVPRRVSALSLSNLTSTTTVFNRINQAIANGDHLIITFHKLVTTPTIDTEWEITKFIDTMAYLASTSVPVVPMSEAMVTDYETLRYFGNFITISGQLGVTGTSTLATTTISSTTIASLVVTGNTSLVGTLGVTGIATLGTANITRLGVNVNNVGSATIEAKSLTAGAIQGLRIEGDNIANTQFSSFLTADSFVRFSFLTDGTMKWGPGTAVADTQLLRNGVNSLQTLGAWTVNGTSTLATTTISNLTVTATTTTNTLRISSLLASRALFTNTTNDVVTSGGSAALLNSLTDETGTGVAVFATAPTFTTSIITPIIGGGTAVGSTLTYRSTSGAGTTDAHIWQVGNNGSIEAMRIIDGGLSGKLNIGTTTATSSLSIAVASSTALMPQTTPWGFMLSMTIAGVSYITHTYDYYGHQIFKGPAPVLTACGTSPTITGSDNGGFITVGTVATGCTMTFANAWITRPTCVISNQNMSITSTLTYSVTATAMVFTQATGFSSNVVNFTCQGQ